MMDVWANPMEKPEAASSNRIFGGTCDLSIIYGSRVDLELIVERLYFSFCGLNRQMHLGGAVYCVQTISDTRLL